MRTEGNKGLSYIFCVFGILLFLEFLELGFISENWYPGYELKCMVWAILFFGIAFGVYKGFVRTIWFSVFVLGWLGVHMYLVSKNMIPYPMSWDMIEWTNEFAIFVVIFGISVELIRLEKKRRQ